MNGKTIALIKRVLAIIVSVLSAAVGVAFITQILRIYSIGGKPYSPEIVSQYFSQIAALVWVWIALVAVSGVFSWIYPSEEKIDRIAEPKAALARMKKRLPMDGEGYSEGYLKNVEALTLKEIYRKTAWIAFILVCIVSAGLMITYLANAENFLANNVTDEVKEMTFSFLPYLVGCFLCALGITIYEGISVKKETELVKSLFKESVAAGYKKGEDLPKSKWQRFKEKVDEFFSRKKVLLVTRACVFGLCVAFIIVGIVNGGLEDVLGKAIRICQECIGLG